MPVLLYDALFEYSGRYKTMKHIITLLVTLFFINGVTFASDKPQVLMETSMGNVTLELYPEKAPISVENFLGYVNSGSYEGTIFHRVMKKFMNQGGGFTADFTKKGTLSPIQNEADNGLKNEIGTIAMARTNAPHSATNQFFINTADNAFLNHSSKTSRGWGYAVFGKVIKGMDVMKQIENVSTHTTARGMQNVPVETILIKKMSVIESKVKAAPSTK